MIYWIVAALSLTIVIDLCAILLLEFITRSHTGKGEAEVGVTMSPLHSSLHVSTPFSPTRLHSILSYTSPLHSLLHISTPFSPTHLHSILPYTSPLHSLLHVFTLLHMLHCILYMSLLPVSTPLVSYHKMTKEDELSDSEEEEGEEEMKEVVEGGASVEKNFKLKMRTEKKQKGTFLKEKVIITFQVAHSKDIGLSCHWSAQARIPGESRNRP